MIKKFMNDVYWGELDFLLIDTPPGTSDEHLAVIENIRAMAFDDFAAILVTTPQVLQFSSPNSTIKSILMIIYMKNLSVNDVRREITFCRKVGIPIAGIVENMSGFTCPHCKVRDNIQVRMLIILTDFDSSFKDCTYLFTRNGGKILSEKTNCTFLGNNL